MTLSIRSLPLAVLTHNSSKKFTDRLKFSADALLATNGKVTLNIPAGVLQAGAYEISLSRMKDGATENVSDYFLRVQEQ
jgi:hypothetical protein